jgi:hypothetical protein
MSSNEECIIFNKNTLDELIIELQRQYDKNIVTEFDDSEIEIVNNVSTKLKNICDSYSIRFNQSEFINFIKRLYIKTQYGGDDENDESQLIPIIDSSKNKKGTNISHIYYDLLALLGFFSSIILLYITYLQFNQMTCTITGYDINELASQVRNDIQNAMNKVKEMKQEDITFFVYFYQIFTTFSSSIIQTQQDRIINLIQDFLIKTIPDVASRASEMCLLGDKSSYVGTFSNLVQLTLTPGLTSSCISTVSDYLINQRIQQRLNEIQILKSSLTFKSMTISSQISYALYLGYGSTSYLIYRTYQIINKRNIKNNEKTQDTNVSEDMKKREYFISKGGKNKNKSKKSRKNKSHKRRKTKKIIKKSRKYKK